MVAATSMVLCLLSVNLWTCCVRNRKLDYTCRKDELEKSKLYRNHDIDKAEKDCRPSPHDKSNLFKFQVEEFDDF